MESGTERMDIREAIADVRRRTLTGIHGDIARLIYLASTRDYNTGRYYHDGLAFKFTEEVAERALEFSHREIFQRLVFTPLEAFAEELETFIQTNLTAREKVIEVWKKLEPYRVTIPQNSDPVSAELFISNVRIALAILEGRKKPNPAN